MSHPSVAVVIFNKSRQTLVLVKQLRPAVLFAEVMSGKKADLADLSPINSLLTEVEPDVIKKGITLELCAGIVDKEGKSLAEIATEEVEEECGFRLKRPIEFVQTFRSSIGTGGARMSLFYAQVSEDDRISSGGGLSEEGEMIEVVELTLEEVKDLLRQDCVNCPTFTLYGLQWFLNKHQSQK